MKNLVLICLLLAFTACSTEEVSEIATPEEKFQPELAYPDIKGTVSEVFYAGMRFPVEEIAGEYVYQGDIIFSKKMVSSEPRQMVYEIEDLPKYKSVGRTSGKWPNNTVYYAIDANLPDQDRVMDAIKHWEAHTNIRFEKRSSQDNYIYFLSGSGCSSHIGMVGGKQNITLSESCSTGNTVHEIGHAIGLWHEQSRVDRNEYITIHYKNIDKGMEHNFDTYLDRGFDGKEFTGSLDFESIMMYGSFYFSKNGKPTITRINGSTYYVQRKVLSTGDISGANNMYPHQATTEPVKPVYENGEYYIIEEVMVYRDWNRWWYFTWKYGWKEVKLSTYGYWYYV